MFRYSQILNAILYVAEQGCKWRGLPCRFGNWHTVYTRMNRWSKRGVLDRVFEQLQRAGIIKVKLQVVSMDSAIVKVHPDGVTGPLGPGKLAEDGLPDAGTRWLCHIVDTESDLITADRDDAQLQATRVGAADCRTGRPGEAGRPAPNARPQVQFGPPAASAAAAQKGDATASARA